LEGDQKGLRSVHRKAKVKEITLKAEGGKLGRQRQRRGSSFRKRKQQRMKKKGTHLHFSRVRELSRGKNVKKGKEETKKHNVTHYSSKK